MKRSDLFFAGLLVPLDYVALVLAGWLAYSLRFSSLSQWLPVADVIPFGGYMRLVLVAAAVWVGVLAATGVFAVRQSRLSSELGKIFFGASTAVLLVILTIFFRREFFSSRFIVLASWVLALILLWITHIIVRSIQRQFYRRGIGVRELVIFGQDQTTKDLVAMFHTQPTLGYRVVKHWPDVTLDALEQFDVLAQQGTVDEVLQADSSIAKTQTLQLIDHCNEHGISFRYAADLFDTQAGHVDLGDIGGVPVISIRRTPLDGWGRIIKRGVDVVGSTVGLAVLAIPGAILAMAIKLDSAGPIFVRLERVGQRQHRFRLWKFRSMVRDAHALKSQLLEKNERDDGPLFKISNDPRITRIGRWLRKTSVDELPQLLNVLRGEMSLVGPRPHEPEEVARYEARHKKLLAIKPGITGLAQISGRSTLTFEEEVRLDLWYIEHWSLSLDLRIIAQTPAVVFSTKHAV